MSLRAQRFGQEAKGEDETDKEKLKEKRAQRFGITASPTAANNGASAEALEKRAKRFGTTATAAESTIEVGFF